MSDKFINGKISFIHHEKNRAVIEYLENDKKKTIQADIDDRAQAKLIAQKIIKKPHRFLVGDIVKFQIKKTGGNGRILYADHVQYLYNTALEILINKAAIENKFTGYIKITDDEYFIKEIDSYLFFPLKISAYEIPPGNEQTQETVLFKLENIENPSKITAVLYNHTYIPAFLTAIQHFKKKNPTEAVVTKISPFAVYLDLFDGQIRSKLTIDESIAEKIADKSILPGTVIPVMISHLSPDRIVVKPIEEKPQESN
jgi:hypothetical protein